MQFSFEIQIGETKFKVQQEAKDHKEFIEKASFFTSLPTKGPNGETDLKLVARKTAKGMYYSVVSETAGQEFTLGQSKDNITLYPKGWEPLYTAQQNTETSNVSAAPQVNIPQQQAQQVQAPQVNNVANMAPNGDQAVNDILAKYNIGN